MFVRLGLEDNPRNALLQVIGPYIRSGTGTAKVVYDLAAIARYRRDMKVPGDFGEGVRAGRIVNGRFHDVIRF